LKSRATVPRFAHGCPGVAATGECTGAMASQQDPEDPVARLLSRLLDKETSRVPTSTLGRFGRTAVAAARAGTGALIGRIRNRDSSGLGAADVKTIEALVMSLGDLKGVAMKVGQILSYVDDSLPPEGRRLLSVLQSRSQPISFAQVASTLRDDLGARGEVLLAELAPEPVSTASIGQVHRARLPDGTQVAVKVRHPGMDAAIRADFRGAEMGKALARLVGPGLDFEQVVAEAKAAFLEECDYLTERANQERFAVLFSDHPQIRIPPVHGEWCSARILTSTWCEGRPFETFVEVATQEERDAAGRALYEFYVGTLYRHGLFNADPHPGNLLFPRRGGTVILDHGCVRRFDAPTVASLVQLARAVRDDDAGRIREAMQRLGARDPLPGPAFDQTRRLLRGFFSPTLVPGRRRLQAGVGIETGSIVRDKRALMRLHLPGRLLFLFRIRFGLYAVIARLGAELDWQGLEDEFSSLAP
jgi:predicted unusual protein kinase regulating ubiquinone biosynthesis (AarF/ABC1/UbiB family)